MPSYLDDSEALKVGTKEMEEHVLAPIEHTVRQARVEKHKKLFQIFSRQGAKEIMVASVAGGALENAHSCGGRMLGPQRSNRAF